MPYQLAPHHAALVLSVALQLAAAGCAEREASGSSEESGEESGLESLGCETFSALLCQAACACDCNLTWPGTPTAFADVPACEAVLTEVCDWSVDTGPESATCFVDLVDTLADWADEASAQGECVMPYTLPASCELFFSP